MTIVQSGVRAVTFGENVTLVEPCNLYECSIGAGTFIGPFVEIQKNVVVGACCRIQSHAFICECVSIGHHCFIGHGVMFVNDLMTRGWLPEGNREQWKKTVIGNHVSLGSNATILPVEICDGAVIGAGAVVTSSITEPGIYAGNPAKFLRKI